MMLAGSLMTFSACSDDEWAPGPQTDPSCIGAYFVAGEGLDTSDNSYYYELEPEAAMEFTLTVGRTNTDGAATVGIVPLVNTENVFQIPESVSFEAGQAETTMTVSFPSAEIGIAYELELALAEGTYDVYNSLTAIKAEVIRIKWNDIETAICIDGLVPNFFAAPYPDPFYVDAEYASLPGGVERVRLTNPYKPATGVDENGIDIGYPNNAEADMVNNNVTMLIEISGAKASIANTALGFDWGYGEFFAGTVASNLGQSEATYPLGVVTRDTEGALESIIFGANSMYSGMANYQDGGAYPASNPTCFFFSLEAMTDYLEEISAE